MSIADNLHTLQVQLPETTQLIGVSKQQPIERLIEAYSAGLRHFGENRVQELQEKSAHLPPDIHWHFIGRLQRNKVKMLLSLPVYRIHSVDSERLFKEIVKEADSQQKQLGVLLQVHIAREESKAGFSAEELMDFLSTYPWETTSALRICGLMGMATFTADEGVIASEFEELAHLFARIRSTYGLELPDFKELSMGMSGDWPLAVSAGSTWVRVGSSIFGSRG